MKQSGLLFLKNRIIFPIFGILLIIAGIISFFLPIIPGTVLILLGITFIGSKRFRKFLHKTILKHDCKYTK